MTAANSSKLNDGAAAMLLVNESVLHRNSLKPLARIIGFCDAATDPIDFPIAPVYATQKVSFKLIQKPILLHYKFLAKLLLL